MLFKKGKDKGNLRQDEPQSYLPRHIHEQSWNITLGLQVAARARRSRGVVSLKHSCASCVDTLPLSLDSICGTSEIPENEVHSLSLYRLYCKSHLGSPYVLMADSTVFTAFCSGEHGSVN